VVLAEDIALNRGSERDGLSKWGEKLPMRTWRGARPPNTTSTRWQKLTKDDGAEYSKKTRKGRERSSKRSWEELRGPLVGEGRRKKEKDGKIKGALKFGEN